jgi:hypothetical protein
MNYSLGNMLSRGGALNPDGLALDLQFAADKTLTARRGPTPTFTRASTATFVGSNGLIQTAAINTPRFDHDPVTLASRGLLIEEARTNLSLYSEALVLNTGWTGLLTSTVSGTGPNGGTAYELAESASNALQTLANTGGTGGTGATSITSGVTYTGSIFLKKISGSVDWVQITLASAGFGFSQYVNINLSNGSIGNSSGGTARIEAHANGWYRVSWTVAANATTASSLNVIIAGIQNTNGTTRTPQYTGSASNRFLAAMCQFELGSFPTSYIPTTTASVVRSADVCSITGSDFSGFYNQSEGTIFTKTSTFNTNNLSIRRIATFSDGTNNNRVGVTFNTGNPVSFVVFSQTAVSALISINASIFSPVLIAACYKLDDFAMSVSGSAVSTDNLGALSVGVSKLDIGNQNGADFTSGHIEFIRYYKKRLPNAKLQSLTT